MRGSEEQNKVKTEKYGVLCAQSYKFTPQFQF